MRTLNSDVVERADLRTLNSKTFRRPDGQLQCECPSDGQIHWQDNDGEFHKVDCTIDKNGVCDSLPYKFVLHKGQIGFDVIDKKNGHATVQLVTVGGATIDDKIKPSIVGNTVTYVDAVPGLDIVFKVLPKRVKTLRILKNAKTPKTLEWLCTYDVDGRGKIKERLIGTDAANKQLDLHAEVITVDSQTLKIVETWTGLVKEKNPKTRIKSRSENVTYPVTIDPTVDYDVSATANDVTEYLRNGSYAYMYDSYLALGEIGAAPHPQNIGMRFLGVAVAQGTTITSATLTLNVTGQGGYGYATGALYGYDIDNAPAWAANGYNYYPTPPAKTPGLATKTSATTTITAATSTGLKNYDVTTIVQEIINRGGWVSGNALSLLAVHTGGGDNSNPKRTLFEDYTDAGTAQPHLSIVYGGGGGVTVTPGVKALTITTYAPTILGAVTVTPSVVALTTTTYAPTIQVGTPGNVGPQNPTAAINTVIHANDVGWVNPTNVYANDSSYATVTPSGAYLTSKALDVTGFDFSAIPSNAWIAGIVVEFERKVDSTAKNPRDNIVQLLLAGVASGSNYANTGSNWPTTEAYATYGTGTTDKWGLHPTVSDIQNSGFGVRIRVAQLLDSLPPTYSIDHVRITVYYTVPVGTTVTPGVLSLTSTAYIPNVVLPVLCTPPGVNLIVTKYVPDASTPILCTPSILTLTSTKYAPTVVYGTVCTPTVLALTSTAYAPTVELPVLCTPPVINESLTTYAPDALTPILCTPPVTNLTLTIYSPEAGPSIVCVPDTLALVITKYVPATDTPTVCIPPIITLALTTYAPDTVMPVVCTPSLTTLTLSQYQPTVELPIVSTPDTLILTSVGLAPDLVTPVVCEPTTLAMLLTPYSPDVTTPVICILDPTILALTMYIPDAVLPVVVTPDTPAFTLSTFAPDINPVIGISDSYFAFRRK